MPNDAMTKTEARAYELAIQAANDWRAGLVQFFAFDSALIAYGDARAAGGRDAMTKADAARDARLAVSEAVIALGEAVERGCTVEEKKALTHTVATSITAYGDRRAVEAEIAAWRVAVGQLTSRCGREFARRRLADAEQRERGMGASDGSQ